MDRPPILNVEGVLLICLMGDLHDRVLSHLFHDLSSVMSSRRPLGVVLNIAGVTMIDGFIAHRLEELSRLSLSLGAPLVIVGMNAAAAATLVEMGLRLGDIHTARDFERGLAWLKARTREPATS